MIHRFYVSNFQSIREGVELDFRIPKTTPDLPRFRRNPADPDTRLPTVAVLIGPNGSGKTTLLQAMREATRFMAESASFPPERGGLLGFSPFLSPENRSQPTRIEVDFDAPWFPPGSGQPSLHRYTLEIHRDDPYSFSTDRAGYEALHAFPKGRPLRVFERRGGKPVRVARGLGLRPGDDRLASIPPHASTISILAMLNVDPFASMTKDIAAIQTNVIVGGDPWRPSDDAAVRMYKDDPQLVARISGALPRFDLGIRNMRIHELPNRPVLGFGHHGLDIPVLLADESAGTRQLVRIYPLFHRALESGSPAIMDDFDAEFHADLAAEIVGWFQSEERNPHGAQLICSSHNLSLLDDLEKEEVFIAEKDPDGATRAYGARRIAGLRRSEDLRKLYRGGVLGGLPTFG